MRPPAPLADDVLTLRDGRRVGYAAFGDLAGDPVLWFHGTPGGRQQVPPTTPSAARARGLRVIGLDRPGVGRSSPHVHDRLVDYADDVRQVVDRLGLDRFAVVGLSGGGPYVLACAHAMPARVVVGAVLGGLGPSRGPDAAPGWVKLIPLAEPLLAAVEQPVGKLLSRAARAAKPLSSPAYDLYARLGPKTDRPVLERPDMKAMFVHDIQSGMEGGFHAPVADAILFARDWGFRLGDVRVPIHFWQGDADLVVPPTHGPHQASRVPGATITMQPGAGHFAGFTNVDDVLDRIRDAWPR